MADRTITGTMQLNARGVELLSQIDSKIDHITSTSRVTSASTAFVGLGVAVAGLSMVASRAKDGFESLLQAGMAAERTRATWNALLGSDQTLVEQRIKELEAFAAKAPFTFSNIQQSAIHLQAIGRYSVDALKAFGDAAAIFNTSIDQATDAALMALRGKTEAIRGFGITTIDIEREMGHKIVEENKRTAKDLDEMWTALIRLMERKGVDGMAKIMGTVSGQLTNLVDAWDRAKKKMGGELMEGAHTGLESALSVLNRMLADGTFERAGQALGGTLARAMDMVAAEAERGLTIADIIAKSGRDLPWGGISEYVYSGDLSRIPQRRAATSIVGELLKGQGQNYKGLFGTWQLPSKYRELADRVALMMISGTPESEARAYASSAILQMAYVGVKEGPAFAPPPHPTPGGPVPGVGGGGGDGATPAAKDWWAGTWYASLFGDAALIAEQEKQRKELLEAMGRLGMTTSAKGHFGARGPGEMPAGDEIDPLYKSQQERLRAMGIETYTILGDKAEMYAARQSNVWARILEEGGTAYNGMQAASGQAASVMIQWGDLLAQKEIRNRLTIKAVTEWSVKSVLAATIQAFATEHAAHAARSLGMALYATALGTLDPIGHPNALAAAGIFYGAAAKFGAFAAAESFAAGALRRQADRSYETMANPESQLPGMDRSGGSGGGSYSRTGSARLVASATAPANYTFAITVNHQGATVYGSGGARQFWIDELLPLAQEAAASGQLSVDPMRRN